MPLAPTIAALKELQTQRQFCIKSQSRCDRSTESFIARFMGYRADASEKERKAIFTRAAAMRRAIEKGGQPQRADRGKTAPADGEDHYVVDGLMATVLSVCTPIILNAAASRLSWDTLRNNVERQMRKLAITLPVWPWVQSVAGFGELGLAIIVGEAGDLGGYATKERVWKRLGLAVIDGERQQRRSNAEEAVRHGYSPKRRAEIWSIGDSMFRKQWAGAKDANGDNPAKSTLPVAVAAHAAGPYGAVYARRKAHTATREAWSPLHRENDARRIMCKALLEDLWRVWNGHGPLNT